MAMLTYTVKRGDSLWKIAKAYPSDISGSTTNAKIDTLVALNNIKNRDLIYVGQVLKLSDAGSTTASSSSAATAPVLNKVTIDSFGLQSGSSTGREVFASWTWSRANTKEFKVRWEFDDGSTIKVSEVTTTDTWLGYTIPTEFHDTVNWVQVFVLPVSDTYESKDASGNATTVPYWTDVVETGKQYFFSENPPLPPEAPEVKIEKLTLTASIKSIDPDALLDAVSIKFNIVQDGSTNIHTSQPVAINTNVDPNVSYQYTVEPGHTYSVRCCSVAANGKESGWSDFSSGDAGTAPPAPEQIITYRREKTTSDSGTTYSVFLEWSPVSGAKKYKVEYANDKSYFTAANQQPSTAETQDETTSILINVSASELGFVFYFRVRAINDYGESEPTAIVELPMGTPPNAPTTWSSSESVFVGEYMELNWMHNPTDNSRQTEAQISFQIGDEDAPWNTFGLLNTTNADSPTAETQGFTYGTAISYKGNLYVELDTNHADLKNKKVTWSVRTAGVTGEFKNIDDGGWSTYRTIYIYEKPELTLSMTNDMSGTGPLITTLTTFPFYIRGQLSLTDYDIQKPVGYHVQIVSNDYYVTVDSVGKAKTINPGDSVYSKYFDTSATLLVEMSANNIDLEPGISYTLHCTANMSTGLTIPCKHDFTVSWVDAEYAINADISVDKDAYTALITPYCKEKISHTVGEGDDAYTTYEEGGLVENVTLSVYRREYDGNYKEIATNIPNNYTAVTDPHPALDYARYRFTARNTETGALSFWDMPGYPVNCSAIIIQWAEAWSTFDVGASNSVEGPPWSGSLLRLPYNIKVTDNRKTEVALVDYAGRKYPVSYYGTQIDETSQWSVEIPKDDKDTIYALRRLSLWTGDVYIREPSGMGYWANVAISFNQAYNDVKIPVTIDVTRVEGGV